MLNQTYQEVREKVNGFAGPAYKRGIFVFKYNGEPVSLFKIDPNDQYDWEHHLEDDVITELRQRYNNIPHKKDFNRITSWGYAVEHILCELMMKGEFFIIKEVNGQKVKGWFDWDGPEWKR